METKTSYCSACGSRCPVVCHVDNGVLVKVESDTKHTDTNPLCPKGFAGPELVYSHERLKYPLKRTHSKKDADPGWVKISWDEAIDEITKRLMAVKRQYGAVSVFFSRAGTAGSPMGENVPWITRLANAFGSPNAIGYPHVCQGHRDNMSNYTYGQGGIGIPEFSKAGCIFIAGHNPHATSRDNLREIRKGREKGAKLVVIDPRKTQLASMADVWLQVKPGTDTPLLLSLIHVLLSEGLYDEAFAQDWTNAPFLVKTDSGDFLTPADLTPLGDAKNYTVWDTKSERVQPYDSLSRSYLTEVTPATEGTYKVKTKEGSEVQCKPALELLREVASRYSPERAQGITGVPSETVVRAARLLAASHPVCYYTYNGVEQHINASQTNRSLCILYGLLGDYDAPGGNDQYPSTPQNAINGVDFLTMEERRKNLAFGKFPLRPPTLGTRGNDLYRTILDEKPYPIKAVMGFGGNIITANAESLVGREALRKLEFFALSEIYMTPTAELADIVLPAATYYESTRLRMMVSGGDDPHTHIQLSPPVIPPLYESKPDIELVFQLAVKLGLGDKFWNGDVRAGFDYRLAPSKITCADLEKTERGVTISLTPDYRKYSQTDPKTGKLRGFATPSGRIELYSHAFKERGSSPLPTFTTYEAKEDPGKYPLTLICVKALPYCHGDHRALPSLRKLLPYPTLEINPAKAKALGIIDGEWVILDTPGGSIRLKSSLTPGIAPDVVATQHGWWQACPELELPGYDPYSSEGANVSLFVPAAPADPGSGSITYKGFPCNVIKIEKGS